jgi:hypothetical protein
MNETPKPGPRLGTIKRGAPYDGVLPVLFDQRTLEPREMWEARLLLSRRGWPSLDQKRKSGARSGFRNSSGLPTGFGRRIPKRTGVLKLAAGSMMGALLVRLPLRVRLRSSGMSALSLLDPDEQTLVCFASMIRGRREWLASYTCDIRIRLKRPARS